MEFSASFVFTLLLASFQVYGLRYLCTGFPDTAEISLNEGSMYLLSRYYEYQERLALSYSASLLARAFGKEYFSFSIPYLQYR